MGQEPAGKGWGHACTYPRALPAQEGEAYMLHSPAPGSADMKKSSSVLLAGTHVLPVCHGIPQARGSLNDSISQAPSFRWPKLDPRGLCQGHELTFAAHRAGIHWRRCSRQSHRQASAGGGRPAAQPCLRILAGKENRSTHFSASSTHLFLPQHPGRSKCTQSRKAGSRGHYIPQWDSQPGL